MARKALFLIAAVASGCVLRPPTPPRLETYTLGPVKANYRAYKGASSGICDAEHRWLSDELAAVNTLFSRYLAESEGDVDGEWKQARLDLLEEATQSMPAIVQIHEDNLNELEGCSFKRKGLLPQIRGRGRELIALTRERLEFTPKLVAYVRAREARADWIRDRPAQEIKAKEVCEPKPKKGELVLYYAWRDDEGKTRFLFCDGAIMTTDKAGATEFVPPPGLSRWQRKRLKQDGYIAEVFGVTPDRISTAPELPARPGEEKSTAESTP